MVSLRSSWVSSPGVALQVLLGTLILATLVIRLPAQESKPAGENPVREIFVPFDELNLLLEGDAQRVFLTREEYEALLTKAQQTVVEHAPRSAVWLSADYNAEIRNERAQIIGRLSLEVLEPGLHVLPLDLNGVSVRAAMLDDQAAPLGRDAQGKPQLFVSGVGRHMLQLELVTAMQTSAAQQTLQVELPTPAATQFQMSVPGNVEVRSGTAVVERVVDEAAGLTRFRLAPPRGPLSLVMSLNNRLLLERRVVLARSVIVDEMTQAYERLHASMSMGVLHGAVNEFRFRIPSGFEITSVESPLLSRWLVEMNENQERILNVSLREPSTGTVVLNIAAIKNNVQFDDWTMPRLEPLDVANHVAVVGLLIEERLAADSLDSQNLIPIDNAVLQAALPASIFQAEPGAPRIRPVAAFFAPQSDYQLQARFTKPPARLDAQTLLLLTLSERQLLMRGTLTLIPSVEKLFGVSVTVPAGWRLSSLTGEDGSPLPFEQDEVDAAQPRRVQVKLPTGVPLGSTLRINLEATSTPNNWLAGWETTNVPLPVFTVSDTTSQTGALAIAAQDDLLVRPDQLTGLVPLSTGERASLGFSDASGALAYRFGSPDYAATLIVERATPRLTARTFSFLKIEPESLSAHYELIFDAQRAGTRKLALSLPASTPESLSISGLDDVQVKEFSHTTVDDRRRWNIELAALARGKVRVAVDFQQRIAEEEPQGYELPVVRAEDVSYQSAIVVAEGSSDFDIEVKTDGRKLDVGELVDADYQVGRRLLGAFGFLEEPEVTVDVHRRPGYGLPTAITKRAELMTLVAASGRSQTAARYLLHTQAAYLQVTLPTGATLWSATVDGNPASPQRDGDDLVISLPPSLTQQTRDLQFVYETPVAPIAFMSDISTDAPQLAVRAETGDERYEVPTADLVWHLVLPEGHRLIRTNGNVYTSSVAERRSPILTLAGVLYALAGGMNSWSGGGGPEALSHYMSDGVQLLDEAATATPPPTAQSMEALTFGGAVPVKPMAEEPKSEPTEAMPQVQMDQVTQLQSEVDNLQAEVAAAQSSLAGQQAARALGGDDLKAKTWALQGVRSLKIDLAEDTGQKVTFQGLGVAPHLQATLIPEGRLTFLAATLAVFVGLLGILRTDKSARDKARFIIVTLVILLVAPLLIGLVTGLEFSSAFEPAIYVIAGLIPFYLLLGAIRWTARHVPSWFVRRTATTSTTAAIALLLVTSAWAQNPAAEEGLDLEGLRVLMQPDKPVALPADAVIIPYDPEDAEGVAKATKVMVPYEEYVRLWNLAYPDQPLDATKPPAPYALAGASYSATLDEGDQLLLVGEIELDVYGKGAVEIPLSLAGGVLERATLDGQPAKIRIVAPQQPVPGQQPEIQQAVAQPNAPFEPPQPIAVLLVTEPGRKRLELAVRLRLERSGGWLIAQGRLPAALATALKLNVPRAQTEVRLSGVNDRGNYETEQDNATIETALPADGTLNLQWRPRVAAAQVDQSLTVQSVGILDVQEDGLRLAWRLDLETRQSQRESFTVAIPADYLVEKVIGDNVRGWQVRAVDGEQQLDVTLLKASGGHEVVTLLLSKRTMLGLDEPVSFAAPLVSVPDAALHQGYFSIRRGPLLDVRAESPRGLSRAELSNDTLNAVLATVHEESPLPVLPFQDYRFTTTPFELQLSARAFQSRLVVEEQMLLRIADTETEIETRLVLTIQERPIYQVRVRLPESFELRTVTTPVAFDWAVTDDNGEKLLTVYLAAGAQPSLNIDLRGVMPRAADGTVAAPYFEVLNVERREGTIVAQVDPAMEVVAEQLVNAEIVPLDQVAQWVGDEQRRLARLAIRYRADQWQVMLRVSPRVPKVSAFSVTNVRVTTREIEETVLLKFRITEAGIREVLFTLPAELSDAEISVPLLRQKTVTPVADDPSRVLVRLELQDDVIDELIVLARNQRALTTGEYTAPLAEIQTGQTDERFVVFESAGRDEVMVTVADGFVELNRQLSQWRKLAEILPGNITQAYVAKENVPTPRLAIQTRARQTVETAGARILLAQTLLIIGGDGAYRGAQEYRVDNKTEQYLEVELPADAQLWTVLVAGEPVKPTVVPNATDNRRVRVPLIKTQTGDLDYGVVLKYGGRMPWMFSLATVEFPLIRTVDIGVEQSQVRLWLPETHRWFNFGGTMRYVRDQGDLTAGVLSYQTKQIEDLKGILRSGSADRFEKTRASNNLKNYQTLFSNLLPEIQQLNSANTDLNTSNAELRREIESNTRALQDAQQAVQEQTHEAEPQVGNRYRFEALYENQGANPSRNVVTQLGDNFDVSGVAQEPNAPAKQSDFNGAWLAQNSLRNDLADKELAKDSREAKGRYVEAVGGKPMAQAEQTVEEFRRLAETESRSKVDADRKSEARDELAEQVQKYQSRLESAQQLALPQNEGVGSPTAPAQDFSLPNAAPGGMGGGGFGANYYFEGRRFGGGLAQNQPASGPMAAGMSVADAGLVGMQQVPASGWASLDVELPQRGTEYYFTTPRGDVQITANQFGSEHIQRLTVLAMIGGGCFVLWGLYWLVRAACRRLNNRIGATVLVLIGLCSLVSLTFPVLGILALVCGIVLFIRCSRPTIPAAATAV